jgi:hypothetical protein
LGIVEIQPAERITHGPELILELLLAMDEAIVRLSSSFKLLDQVADETCFRKQHVKRKVVANAPVDTVE